MDIIETPEIAAKIGALYRQARDSHRESIAYLIECGQALKRQKAALLHGEWLIWLKVHEDILGFKDRAARLMMAAVDKWAAKRQSTADLTDDEACKFTRAVWGNEPEVSPIPHDPFQNFERFRDWAAKHHTDFVELSAIQRASLMELHALIGRVLTLPIAKEAA